MTPALLAVLSAFLHPWTGIFAKKAAHPLTLNFWGILILVLCFIPAWATPEFWNKCAAHWELVGLSTLFKTSYGLISIWLISRLDFQVLYPLTRLAPLLILLGEIYWLGSNFSLTQTIGILSVGLGALIFFLDQHLSNIRIKILSLIGVIALSVAAFELIDKQLLTLGFTPAEIVSITLFQLPLLIIPCFFFRKEAWKDLKNWKVVLLYAFSISASFFCSRLAMAELDAAVVASVRNLSIIFGVFLGGHIFMEGHKSWRYLAGACIVGGAALAIL